MEGEAEQDGKEKWEQDGKEKRKQAASSSSASFCAFSVLMTLERICWVFLCVVEALPIVYFLRLAQIRPFL